MKLIPDWRRVLTRAWSVHVAVILTILSGVAGVLQVYAVKGAPIWLLFGSAALSAVLPLVRIVAQKDLADFLADESGVARGKVTVAAAMVAAVMAVAVPFTRSWEGEELTPYYDVVGVLTVCNGETEGVSPGDRFTPEDCARMLERRLLQDYYLPILACAPELAEAPVSVQAAVTSWAYNVGVGAACGSTLARYLRASDWRAACEQLPRWNRAGGKVWQGLVNRRADERALCLSGLR